MKREEKLLCEIVNKIVEENHYEMDKNLDIDWKYFYYICEKNRIQYWVIKEIKDNLPENVRQKFDDEQYIFRKKVNAYWKELRNIISICQKLEIPIMCIKGIPLA